MRRYLSPLGQPQHPAADLTDPPTFPWSCASTWLVTKRLPLLALLLIALGLGQGGGENRVAASISSPERNALVQHNAVEVQGLVLGLGLAADLRSAYRRPGDPNLTISAQSCAVDDDTYRCPPFDLPTTCRRERLEIVIVLIDDTVREQVGDAVLDSGAPVTLPLPRNVEMDHVSVRCS